MRPTWLGILLIFPALAATASEDLKPIAGPDPAPLADAGSLAGAKPEPVEAGPETPLSPAESSLQGRWQGFDHRRGHKTWTLDVEGRGFYAAGSGEWYEGRLVVSDDQEPAGLDFVIERCRCAYDGATSLAVFSRQGETLLVAATAPGNPRPTGLEARAAQLLRFVPR